MKKKIKKHYIIMMGLMSPEINEINRLFVNAGKQASIASNRKLHSLKKVNTYKRWLYLSIKRLKTKT